jgi:hypothetical protein
MKSTGCHATAAATRRKLLCLLREAVLGIAARQGLRSSPKPRG